MPGVFKSLIIRALVSLVLEMEVGLVWIIVYTHNKRILETMAKDGLQRKAPKRKGTLFDVWVSQGERTRNLLLLWQ
jgi:hypothetical protein